ncbi:MAG: DUF2970 domain-containing protein [Porticoccaceae bacterium]
MSELAVRLPDELVAELHHAARQLRRTLAIVPSGHLGVRSSSKRKEDFARSQRQHVAAVAVPYSALVITALIALANVIAR